VTSARTLFEKVWNDHVVVAETADTPAILYIDLHLIHEVTTPQAFNVLHEKGLHVRRPDLTLATMDHSTPTTPVTSFKDMAVVVGESAANQVRRMQENCDAFGLELLGFESDQRSRARRSSAATAIRAHTAHSAPSPSASAQPRSAMYWLHSVYCSANPEHWL